jgi:DNA-binding Lrp family transcriptional regulator
VGLLDAMTSDGSILAAAQTQLPLVRQPFSALARSIGASARRVMHVLRDAQHDGRVRRIGGVFEARAMGYRSALLALDVEDIVSAGQIVATHPGTSHVYERLGPSRYSLWATLAVSADSTLGFDGTVARLAELTGASDVQILPALKRYKLDARFGPARPSALTDRPARPHALADADRLLVRLLQRPLPVTSRPFDPLAREMGIDTSAFLSLARRLRSQGILRRVSAVANHRRLGATMNVMAVWSLTGRDADRAGILCASSPAVSHCFLRRTGPAWPYGFYAMIHGPSQRHCRDTIETLSEGFGAHEGLALWTGREFKKSPVAFFDPDERAWECENR